MNKQFTLKARERIKSRKMLEQIFAGGQKFHHQQYRVHYLLGPAGPTPADLQFGCSAPVRHFKKAVHRNRVKRLLREAFRLQKTGLKQHLHQTNRHLSLFVIYASPQMPDFMSVKKAMDIILKKLVQELEKTHD